MLFILLICSDIFSSIWPWICSFTLHFIVFKRPFINSTIDVKINSFSVYLATNPVPFICWFVRPYIFSMPIFEALMIISLEFASIWPSLNSKSMRLIVFPVSLIWTIFSIIFSIPLNDSMIPKTLKSETIGTDENSRSMWKILNPCCNNFSAISPSLLSLMMSLSLLVEISMILWSINEFDMIFVLSIFLKGEYIGLALMYGLILYLRNELNFKIKFIVGFLGILWGILFNRSKILWLRGYKLISGIGIAGYLIIKITTLRTHWYYRKFYELILSYKRCL